MLSELEVSYSQVAVFDARMECPFSDWSKVHVDQGFVWRPGTVSFGTLLDSGTLKVEVLVGSPTDLSVSSALRIISVPFVVPEHGEVEIASIASSIGVVLGPGACELQFEHGMNEACEMWCVLRFVRNSLRDSAEILRADSELRPPHNLDMSGSAA